jgi:hypothetical protein
VDGPLPQRLPRRSRHDDPLGLPRLTSLRAKDTLYAAAISDDEDDWRRSRLLGRLHGKSDTLDAENAEPELWEQLQPLPRTAFIERCAGVRPGPIATALAATKHTLRGDCSAMAAAQRPGDEIEKS